MAAHTTRGLFLSLSLSLSLSFPSSPFPLGDPDTPRIVAIHYRRVFKPMDVIV